MVSKRLIDKTKILSNLSRIDLNVESQNKNLRIKNISSKSPEYVYRLYFEAWQKKIERMGSMNYPEAAIINNSFNNLVMKVTINSNIKRIGTINYYRVVIKYPFLTKTPLFYISISSLPHAGIPIILLALLTVSRT